MVFCFLTNEGEMLSVPVKLRSYGKNAAQLAIFDANERLFRLICETLEAQGKTW